MSGRLSCNVVVDEVIVSAQSMLSFDVMIDELIDKGYARFDRKYLLWTDYDWYCGIASLWLDDTPDGTNLSNLLPGWARVDNGCWGLEWSVEAHELGHVFGAVQNSADRYFQPPSASTQTTTPSSIVRARSRTRPPGGEYRQALSSS